MSVKRRRRGPQLVHEGPLPEEGQLRVLMPELLGRVVGLARDGVGATQREVGQWLQLPPSTVGKLERGDVAMGTHHLDSFARAFCHFGAQLHGSYAVTWRGWELHKIADEIARTLRAAGYYPVWQKPKELETGKVNADLYLRGKQLTALIRKAWPEGARDRL